MAQWICGRINPSTSKRKSAYINGSPPVNVTPPLLSLKILSYLKSLSANSFASISVPLITVSSFFFMSCGFGLSPSGLWHHSHRNGQPFKKKVVLMPGPSLIANSSMLNIVPFMQQRYIKKTNNWYVQVRFCCKLLNFTYFFFVFGVIILIFA